MPNQTRCHERGIRRTVLAKKPSWGAQPGESFRGETDWQRLGVKVSVSQWPQGEALQAERAVKGQTSSVRELIWLGQKEWERHGTGNEGREAGATRWYRVQGTTERRLSFIPKWVKSRWKMSEWYNGLYFRALIPFTWWSVIHSGGNSENKRSHCSIWGNTWCGDNRGEVLKDVGYVLKVGLKTLLMDWMQVGG